MKHQVIANDCWLRLESAKTRMTTNDSLCKMQQRLWRADCLQQNFRGPFLRSPWLPICKPNGLIAAKDCRKKCKRVELLLSPIKEFMNDGVARDYNKVAFATFYQKKYANSTASAILSWASPSKNLQILGT